MAGYSKLYCIGGTGGFMGSDGINPIIFQILVGDADRQWLEPHYFDTSISPIGRISAIIPEGPYHPNSLIDACIAFAPRYFERCPALARVKYELNAYEGLDFHMGTDEIPDAWYDLRKQALHYFKRLVIFEANLTRVDLMGYSIE